MKHRKLRIAWSVASGIVAVLLVVLWVRSYWWRGTAFLRIATNATQETYYDASSDHGGMTILATDYPQRQGFSRFGIGENPAGENKWPTGLMPQFSSLGFAALYDGARMRRYVTVPDWCTALLILILSVLPWIRWPNRFSLRALLIATTLVAVGLGLFALAPK